MMNYACRIYFLLHIGTCLSTGITVGTDPLLYNEVNLAVNGLFTQLHHRKGPQHYHGSKHVHHNAHLNTIPVFVDFEGVGDTIKISNFYSEQGVAFSSSAVSMLAMHAGGCCGIFSGESVGNFAMTFMKTESALMFVQGM